MPQDSHISVATFLSRQQRILDIIPTILHQRCSFYVGSADAYGVFVDRRARVYADDYLGVCLSREPAKASRDSGR